MWNIETDTGTKRTYTNTTTGGKCVLDMVYTDNEGNKWWGFTDLMALPYTRNFAATKVTSLFALGLSKQDLTSHIEGLKAVLKSQDKDKYEKAYANILEFESKANSATDALKQMSALVCVYFTLNDEAIDSFDNNLQIKKMSLIEADPAMHSFFLNRQITLTENYTTHLRLISEIASGMNVVQ